MNDTSPDDYKDVIAALRAFVPMCSVVSVAPFGDGHINSTYRVETGYDAGAAAFIVQRINTNVFRAPDAMMNNIVAVTQWLSSACTRAEEADAFVVLSPLRRSDGTWLFYDDAGGVWRVFDFVPNTYCTTIARTPHHAYEAARIFGQFHQLLRGFPADTLHETIPAFHATAVRVAQCEEACASDPLGRFAEVIPEVDFMCAHADMCTVLPPLIASGDIPLRVTHNDTKISNVLFSAQTDAAVCVVDLDTVMPGSVLYDFGDCVRSTTCTVQEDEKDASRTHMDMHLFTALTEGYMQTAGTFLTQAERAHLAFSAQLITYEIGVRFLTDYLLGDVYFKIKRPTHNRDRARVQFALMHSMMAQYDAMRACVDESA